MPQVEAYDGLKDPLNHLESFKTLIHLQSVVGRDHVSSLPDYAEGSYKGIVQQVDAQLHQYLQRAENTICLALYQRGTGIRSSLCA